VSGTKRMENEVIKFIEIENNECYPSIKILNKKKKTSVTNSICTQYSSIYLHGQIFIPELVNCKEGNYMPLSSTPGWKVSLLVPSLAIPTSLVATPVTI